MAGITALVAEVAQEMETSQVKARVALDAVITSIVKKLLDGETVSIRGFGVFKVKNVKARVGRNPATGEPIHIPARDKVTFKASK